MIIKEKDREVLKQMFGELENPVRLVVFTQKGSKLVVPMKSCQYCEDTVNLVQEVASLSDLITTEVYDFDADKEQVDKYEIDKVPAIAIVGDGEKDYGVRYYGIPAGYEFSSLIEDIIDVSAGKTDLSEESLQEIAEIDAPVHIQVFVTPTCPYCPSAVRLAHKMAIANPNIRADMVEAQEFPELSQRYNVYGVPRTVINDDFHFEGAVPEQYAVKHVLHAAGKISEDEMAQMGIA